MSPLAYYIAVELPLLQRLVVASLASPATIVLPSWLTEPESEFV